MADEAAATKTLKSFNQTARSIYAEGRAELLAATDPVILVSNDLVLRHGGREQRETYLPALYQRLKDISHIALGVVGALVAPTTGVVEPDDKAWREDLETLTAAAKSAREAVEAVGFSEATRQRQRELLYLSLDFMAAQLSADRPTWEALHAFGTKARPLVLANATEATNAQLEAMDAIVTRWHDEVGEEAWSRLYVLVLGPKTPRVDNAAMQYFEALLGPGSKGTRVIYAEDIFDETQALELLGTLLIDRYTGAVYFDDGPRMERDLLGDAATVKILKMFGKLGTQ